MKYYPNHRFGNLTLISFDNTKHPTNPLATLKCDCGNTAYFYRSVLINGHNTDCGCSELTSIYFIQTGDFVKIGRCKPYGIKARLAVFQTHSPYSVHLIRVIKADRSTEKTLHRLFSHLHHHGEWFRYSPEMLTTLEESFPCP